MPFTAILKQSVQMPGSPVLSFDAQAVGNVAPAASAVFATGSTNAPLSFACDQGTLQMLYMVSTQAIDVKTNSSGSPDDTFSLAAGIPLVWHAGDPAAPNPLTADVTQLFITNSSGQTAKLEIRALHN
jgi:hypothetical protein